MVHRGERQGIQRTPVSSEGNIKKEKSRPTVLGILVSPEKLGVLPSGEMPVATFNAAMIQVRNPLTATLEQMAVYRVQTQLHIEGHADGTAYFGMQRFEAGPTGIITFDPTFQDAKEMLQPGDTGNLEDMRLACDDKGVYGALTKAVEVTREELYHSEGVAYNPGEETHITTIPIVATITGQPIRNSLTGSIESIRFAKAQTAREITDDGTTKDVVGKNAWEEHLPDGKRILRYRPEFSADGQTNQTRVRTLVWGDDGYWHSSPEFPDRIYPKDNLSDILPPGYQLLKFGLNGSAIPGGQQGESPFRIDHVASVKQTPQGNKIEYGFITVDGKIKPLLSYTEAIDLLKDAGISIEGMQDLTGEKNVIYCNGYAVVGNKLVMAVTFFDRMSVVLSYDMHDLSEYAIEPNTKESLQSTSSRRNNLA